MKPMKRGPNGPGKAFWMVLIVIGSVTVWQKVVAPATEAKTGKAISESSLVLAPTPGDADVVT